MVTKNRLIAAVIVAALAFHALPRRESRGVDPNRASGIALVDVGFVLQNHARLNQSLARLGEEVKASEARLQQAGQELQRMAATSNDLKPGSGEWKALEDQMARRRAQLELEVRNQRSNFYQQESTLYAEVAQELNDAVQRYADRNGIHLVLRTTRTPNEPTDRQAVLADINKEVVFSRDADITSAILDELNRGPLAPATARRP